MRPTKPRIPPLQAAECSDEQRTLLEPFMKSGTDWNVFRTLARHTSLFKRWMPFMSHVLHKQTLSFREREILILRIGWLCRAPYEWAQHVQVGLRAGLSEMEIERIADGPDAAGWSRHDAALVRAADELHRDACIADATWSTLAETYSPEQMLDVIFTVGQYNMVSMALNSLGVEIDQDLPRFGRMPAVDA
jgi:4-carboxymuconolactone decarboxylase